MPKYERLRAWIKENIDAGDFKTYEDFLVGVLNKPGINKINDVSDIGTQLNKDYSKEFTFQSQKELTEYIDKQKQRIKEELKALEKLQKAKSQKEVEEALPIIEKPKEKIVKPVKEPIKEVPITPKPGLFTRVTKGVRGFFKGLFGGK